MSEFIDDISDNIDKTITKSQVTKVYDYENADETIDNIDNVNNNVIDNAETTEIQAINIEYIDASKPIKVIYCPHCSFPSEYCEYGALYNEKCLPWILENCPEILGLGEVSLEDEDNKGDGKKNKKKAGVSAPKKKAPVEIKVILQLVQRQKKKMLTVVTGLETVPDLKIKDAARSFGKKFSSGTSIGDTPTGGKEVVIQGDVIFQLPDILTKEFKIPITNIYVNEGGSIRPL